MKKQNENEELQSRREFFKEAAKKALPLLGAIALASSPIVAKAAEKEPMSCNSACSVGCGSNCSGYCDGTCTSTCGRLCNGCQTSCQGGCLRNCNAQCRDNCYTACFGYSGR